LVIACFWYQNIEPNDENRLTEVLREYFVVCTDNNFETFRSLFPGIGNMRGADFLVNKVGPCLKEMPPQDRLIVVYFAPSSRRVLQGYEEHLWEKYETVGVGFAVRIFRKHGVVLSRETIASKICGQSLVEDNFGSPKAEFFRQLAFSAETGSFRDEGYEIVEKNAKLMEWTNIVGLLAKGLKVTSDEMQSIIDREVSVRRNQIEGQSENPDRRQ